MRKSYNNLCTSVSYGSSSCNRKYVMRSTEMFQPEPITQVRAVNYGTADAPCIKLRSDVKLLLDQKRISDQIGLDAVKAWLERIQPKDLSPKAKLSDSDLLKYVKSRYVQAPCELKSWSDYLDRNRDRVVGDLNDIFASLQPSPSDPNGDPAPAPAE